MFRKSSWAMALVLVIGFTAYGVGRSPTARATTSAPIKVTSLSSANCYPLTPLTLKVSGLTTKGSIVVRFTSRPSGRLITSAAPLSVKGSSVVVAVPLDTTAAGALSHGSATLTISQGARVSAKRMITIAPLPTDVTYGTQPGEITKYFLDLQASMIGARLDQLGTVGAEYGIDTTAAQGTLNSLLDSTLLSLNDVNRIIADPTTVIDGPTTSSGFTPKVNEQFIETMDQIYGAYLVNEFGSYASSLSLSGAVRPRLFAPSLLREVIGTVKNATTVNDAQEAFEKSGGNIAVGYFAVAGGAMAFIHQLTKSKLTGVLAEELVVAASIVSIGSAMEDQAFTVADMVRANYQGDIQSYAADEAQLQLDSDQLLKVSGSGLISGLQKQLPQSLQNILDLAIPLVNTESQLLYSTAEILGFAPEGYTADEMFLTLGKAIVGGTLLGTGIGLIQGQADITNDAGNGAALQSTQLCCVSSSNDGINGMVDPGGSYELWYPLGVPNTNYSSLTLNVYDFVRNFNTTAPFTALSWEDLDLATPTPGQATIAPTLSGVCSDTDWQGPDGDDPDCD